MSTPKGSLPVRGVVARLGMVSADGREIDPAGFTVEDLPLPLMGLFGPGPGHSGALVVGRIDEVDVVGDEVRIVGKAWPEGKGEAVLPPGTYSCGVDVAGPKRASQPGGRLDMEMQLVRADGTPYPGEGDPEDAAGLVQRVTLGELIAVTVHGPGSTTRAVWPGVSVTVGAPS